VSEDLGWLDEGDWSPNGRWIALLSTSKAGYRWILWNIDLDTGIKHEVVSDTVPLSAPRWSLAGDALYYVRDQNELRKIAITPQGIPRGAPEILQSGLGATHLSITADGRKLAYTKEQGQSNLWLATLSEAHPHFTTTQLTHGTAEKTAGRLSPDGHLVAFLQLESGRADVYVIPAEGGLPRRVTSTGNVTATTDWPPAWSPDGRRLAFVARLQGGSRVQTAALEGGDDRIYERTEASDNGDLAWAPQERILYQRVGHRNYHWLDPETGTEEPLVANDSVGWMFNAIQSSDGQHVAVFWNRPRRGTYVISLRDASQAPLGPRNAWPMGWSADNTSVYVQDESEGRIRRVALHGGKEAVVAINPFKNADCNLSERPAGLVLLCKVDNSISDAWLVEDFDPTVGRRPLAH
jgi:Tol biopolymer transport system component